MNKNVTDLTVEQLRDILVLSDDIISVLTAHDELRRRGVPVVSTR